MIKNSNKDAPNYLTDDQRAASEKFESWLSKNIKDQPFILSGYAGTGKTFLSIKLLRKVESKGLCWTVVAPTHKAVGVLRDALTNEGLKATWYPSTIHRLLRLKVKRKGGQEICERSDKTTSSLKQINLVLIDEASMIDSHLLEITLQCAQAFKTRLIFVGDPAQLPPINEPKSPIFQIKNSYLSTLKQVVRHKGAVLKLANLFRDGHLACKSPPCFPSISNNGSLVGSVETKNWMEQAQQRLKDAASAEDPDMARILCYTNKTVDALVPHARRAIHGEMADQLPVLPGEVLITRTAVMTPASLKGLQPVEEPNMVLGSNRELIVNDVKPELCDLRELGIEGSIDCSLPKIQTLIANARSDDMDLTLRLIPPVGTESRAKLDSTLKELQSLAKASGKAKGRSIWKKFFLIRDSFASLGPAAVLTIHRSQGSTFNEVFIHSDVFSAKDIRLSRQLIYVAITRAKNKVWLIGCKKGSLNNDDWQEKLRSN